MMGILQDIRSILGNMDDKLFMLDMIVKHQDQDAIDRLEEFLKALKPYDRYMEND